MVQQHAPHLVREYEARLQAGERAKEEKELKKMQRLAKRAAKTQLQTGPSLADYFPQVADHGCQSPLAFATQHDLS